MAASYDYRKFTKYWDLTRHEVNTEYHGGIYIFCRKLYGYYRRWPASVSDEKKVAKAEKLITATARSMHSVYGAMIRYRVYQIYKGK